MPGVRTRAGSPACDDRLRRARAQFEWIECRRPAARSQCANRLDHVIVEPGLVEGSEPVRFDQTDVVEPVRFDRASVQPGAEPVRFDRAYLVEPDPVEHTDLGPSVDVEGSDGPVDEGLLDRYVAVVGPGDGATDQECELAEETGALLAAQRTIVVTGGLGGVMAAAAQGAQRAGGRTVGLLPGLDRVAAAESNSVVIRTGLGQLRNGLVVNSADGVIAIGGSWGTLSELALARRVGRPVVSLRGWTIRDQEGNPLDQDTADSPEEAVMRLLAQLRARSAPHKS